MALDQFIAEEAIRNSGIVSFGAVNGYIHRFSWGFFVVDNDPSHEDLHPVDEHLLSLQDRGMIAIDMEGENIRITGKIINTP